MGMGREKDAKEEGEVRPKAAKLKKPSGPERNGAGGDSIKKKWVKMPSGAENEKTYLVAVGVYLIWC